MALSAKAPNQSNNNYDSSDLDVPTADKHMARLVGITDIGHQPGFVYQGKDIPSAYKYTFTYELPASLMKDGRPHWVSEDIKRSDFEDSKTGRTSTLMYRVRTLDRNNESEDGAYLDKLLGKPCFVDIELNEKGYPRIPGQAGVSKIPSGMDVPELVNPTFMFDMDDPDMDVWNSFSDFAQMKIKTSLEFDQSALAKKLAEGDEY